MGSEMCIRDSLEIRRGDSAREERAGLRRDEDERRSSSAMRSHAEGMGLADPCTFEVEKVRKVR